MTGIADVYAEEGVLTVLSKDGDIYSIFDIVDEVAENNISPELEKMFSLGTSHEYYMSSDEYRWLGQALDDELETFAFEPMAGFVVVFGEGQDIEDAILDLEVPHVEYADVDGAWVIRHDESNDPADEVGWLYDEFKVAQSPRAGQVPYCSTKDAIFRDWLKEAKEEGGFTPTMFRTERTLKPHQEDAVIVSSVSSAILNADEVGLCKGGEFVCSMLAKVQKRITDRAGALEDAYPFVVVTKSSLKAEIAEEIVKWDNDANVVILEGKSAVSIDPDAQFIVVNDAIVTYWKDYIIDAEPKGLVVDEAHSVNNPTAKRTQAVQKIADAVRKYSDDPLVILATATPFQNGPYELWGLLKILGLSDDFAEYARNKMEDEGEPLDAVITTRARGGRTIKKTVELYGKMAFEARWCNGHAKETKSHWRDKSGRVRTSVFANWHNRGASHSSELFELLASNVMIRRTKSDVMSPMPELHQKQVFVDLLPSDKRLYATKELEFRQYMKERTTKEARKEGTDEEYALKVLTGKLDTSEAVMRVGELRKSLGQMKARLAVEWIKEFFDTDKVTGGDPRRDKLIVFCHHKEAQRILVDSRELRKYGMVHITDTNTSMSGVQEAKRRFQKDPDTRLIICNSGAVAGHTLTAAYDTLMVELLYGPVATMQAAGRNWARFSEEYEPHEAFFHLMIANGTLDLATFHSNLVKKSLMNGYIDGDEIDMDLVENRDLRLDERMEIARDIISRSPADKLVIAN